METLLFVLLVGAALLSLILGLVVLLRDYRKLENSAFFALTIGIASWCIGIAGFNVTNDLNIALGWAKFYYIAPLLIVTAAVIFVQQFIKRQPIDKWYNASIIFTGLVFALAILFKDNFVISQIVDRSYGKQATLDNLTYLIYGAYLTTNFALVVLLTFLKRRRIGQPLAVQQISIFMYGFIISCLLGLYFNLILPGFGNYELIALGPISTAALAFAVAYAIVRHQLFDIRLVIARAVGYTTSLMVLALVYGFIVFGIAKFFFDIKFELSVQIYLSIATAIAGLAFSRLRPYFDKLTNSVFYRDAYDTQELFDDLNKVLVSTVDVERLLKGSAESIAHNLKAQYCMIGLHEMGSQKIRLVGTKDMAFSGADVATARHLTPHIHESVIVTDNLDEKHNKLRILLKKNNVVVLVRLATNVNRNEEGLGYIVLGAKKSGNPYNTRDLKVLDTIAKELIIAIQNAIRVEEIQNFNLTLQERITEATRKLRRTNEKLKALDEAKDDFVSMASHQLRTPLTSIKGYTSMVLEGDAGKINATQRKLLEQSFTSSQRMVYLIADLLNVSRLKTGKFIIEEHPINIAEMVQQEIGQLKESAAGRSLTLTYDMPENFPSIMLDETKTRQVIMNFIDNAIYYTPAGGNIEVKVIETPSSVEFRVVDDGIGVPKAEQPHLFTKFYRAGNARTARPDGTGLGLFMAKKVVIAQGGALLFESVEGKGSTFGFVFSKSAKAVPPQH